MRYKHKKVVKNKTTERVAIYYDGSNFYHKLKGIGITNISHFNYYKFSLWLAKKREIISNRYYVGVIRADKKSKKGQKMRAAQQKLFYQLKRKRFVVKGGYLMKSDGVYHEKGTDVKIATDILVGAYEDIYDTAILVSSDTDLIPAIKKARALGKKVEHIGFYHQPSFAMQNHCSFYVVVRKKDLTPFTYLR